MCPHAVLPVCARTLEDPSSARARPTRFWDENVIRSRTTLHRCYAESATRRTIAVASRRSSPPPSPRCPSRPRPTSPPSLKFRRRAENVLFIFRLPPTPRHARHLYLTYTYGICLPACLPITYRTRLITSKNKINK